MMSRTDKGPTGVAEYDGNPFISALPPPMSITETLAVLSRPPAFSPEELKLPCHIRRQLVWRLTRFMEPQDRQLDLAEKIGTVIRQGYVGRNPRTGDHHRHVLAGAERTAAGSLVAPVSDRPPVDDAWGFALTGCSGMGKSASTNMILNLFPQVIEHPEGPLSHQLVWLKLDCPYKGSEKALCIDFFNKVDGLLGTKYTDEFGSHRNSNERMMIDMARIAQLHALGVLTIDEIQHTRQAKGGPRVFLNFLVTLVNMIGVPVIVIGTMGAATVIQDNFREARRAGGCGSPVWEPLKQDAEWDSFLTTLWRYQWLRDAEVEPSKAISEALYDESQGIIDIVLRLFMLAQWRALVASEIRDSKERLTPKLIRQVAAEDLRVIQPMIRALRQNDREALEKYDDLKPFHLHVANVMQRGLSVADVAATRSQSAPQPGGTNDAGDPVRSFLEAAGHAEDVIDALLAGALEKEPSADPFRVLAIVQETLSASGKKPPKPRLVRAPPIAGDLRFIVAEGEKRGLSPHDALVDAGLVRSVPSALAA